MKIILLKDVPKVGKKYDIKDISDGYALNLLIPQKLAIAATPDAVKRVEADKKKETDIRKMEEDLLVKNFKALEATTLTISGKANDKGHLFAGLHREVLAAELKKHTRLDIPPQFIQLAQPIKTLGEHMVEVKAAGKAVVFKVVVAKA